MRGDDRHPDAMFSYVAPEQRVPPSPPQRPAVSVSPAGWRAAN